jgi:WD40 repeat protein
MLVKSGLLAAGLVCVLGVVGYFALRASHASPAIAAKQAEGPMGLPELTDIDGLARSRDGRILATVSQYTVSLWDATSGQNLLVLQNGDNESIFAPAFSRDGSLLATVSTAQRYKIEGHLLLWNPATGERLGSIDNLSYPGCASFNPAGTLIAVGGNTLYLVDPSTKEIVQQIDRPHQNGGTAPVVFNPNGEVLATGGRDGTVKLWKLPDLTLARTFSVSDPSPYVSPSEGGPPRAIVSSLAFAHDVPRLAAVTRGGSVFVWDLASGKEIVHYDYSAVTRDIEVIQMRNWASFTSDDKWLVTTNQKGDGITLLGAKRKKEVGDLLTLRKHTQMKNLDFSPTDGSVAFAYRIFQPGVEGPPLAKFEIWSLQLR